MLRSGPLFSIQEVVVASELGSSSGAGRRLTTETKSALKTTEFALTVAVIVAILICAAAIKGGDNGTDEFIARNAWLYVAIVTGAYAVGRGLAKSGSYDPYTEEHDSTHQQ